MPAFITFGRILFAVLFIYSGATKLFGIQATADFIAAKVVIPALFVPYTSQLETMTGMPTPQLLAIAIGAFEVISGLMIALSSFGREFAMGTFPGLLALPLTRARIWWIKIGVLSAALAAIFGTFYFAATYLISLPGDRSNSLYGMGEPANFTTVATVCVAIFASGLWTTLLLRQMMAAFWFALLVPAAILTVILWNGGTAATAEIVLGLYSIAGFVWAWRQFYRAQEVAWTGGEINLPDWQSTSAAKGASGRNYRPLAAFVWKEIRLYREALLGMAGLFVLHLGVVVVRKIAPGNPGSSCFNLTQKTVCSDMIFEIPGKLSHTPQTQTGSTPSPNSTASVRFLLTNHIRMAISCGRHAAHTTS